MNSVAGEGNANCLYHITRKC